MVEGGYTPIVPADELGEMGYGIVLYANALSRLASAAVRRGLDVLITHGTTDPIVDDMLSWEDLQAIAGLQDWQSFEANVVDRAASATVRQLRGEDYAR